MTHFVTVTFDIANGQYNDYQTVYKDFAELGLSRSLQTSQGKVVKLPTTTTAGEFNGASAAAVRDQVCTQAQQCFTRRGLQGEIFVSVGGDWAWGHRLP